MFCEQCGALVPDGMKFCDQCGAPVAVIENTPMQTGTGQYNMQPEMQNNMQRSGQQGMPGQNKTKKSPLVPIMIAAAAVLVLGLGSFLVYKNFAKIKELTAKIKKDERETRDTPAKDAITGGKWARNGSGGHIYNLNGEMQKKCWVEIRGEYYYVDASGYRMSDNWSHDGFYVGEEGLWDESVDRRMDDPVPLAEISYVNQAYKDNTGECKSAVFSGKKGTAALEYQWDDVIYDVTSMGHGTYILTDSSGMLDPMDVVHTLVMSVSEDQRKVMISEYGYTTVLEADRNYSSNGPGKTAENGSDSKGSGSGNITITDIVEMAKTKSGAPNAELDSVDQDGTLNIRLYGNGTQDTWDWYYIDPKTLRGTNITGNVIDLNK